MKMTKPQRETLEVVLDHNLGKISEYENVHGTVVLRDSEGKPIISINAHGHIEIIRSNVPK